MMQNGKQKAKDKILCIAKIIPGKEKAWLVPQVLPLYSFRMKFFENLAMPVSHVAKIIGMPYRTLAYWVSKGYIDSVEQREKGRVIKKLNWEGINQAFAVYSLRYEQGSNLEFAVLSGRLLVDEMMEFREEGSINLEISILRKGKETLLEEKFFLDLKTDLDRFLKEKGFSVDKLLVEADPSILGKSMEKVFDKLNPYFSYLGIIPPQDKM